MVDINFIIWKLRRKISRLFYKKQIVLIKMPNNRAIRTAEFDPDTQYLFIDEKNILSIFDK